MRWASVVSAQNLRLAWRRINTAKNLQYKRFFRESYLVYESSVAENLRELRRNLLAGVWEPSHATRIYLPKPSGLQRPISLLAIEDQIVLQAVANVFAGSLRNRRRRVELDVVFSNKLADQADSIFFTERWQTTYRKFQDKCEAVYADGFKWAADFDLAAYYDTISHDLLLRIVSPRNSHPETIDRIRHWLQIWSADDRSAVTGHGIPQGPIASDFLAEAFLLPIDIKLRNESFKYVRYVDDIRLFGRSENEVRKAAIKVEQECRHRGLIPQTAKFSVRELKNAQDALGALPSISPEPTSGDSENMDAKEARNLLETCIGGKPLKVEDRSRFRYVMYRAPADTAFLNRVLMLLPRHPEHIDAFAAYFGNFTKRKSIASAALKWLASDLPYSYVRGELWHIAARLASATQLSDGLQLARLDARDRRSCVALSWGVMHYLIRCEQEGLCRIGQRLSSEHPISRSLLGPVLPAREFKSGRAVTQMLRGTIMEQLSAIRELQKRGRSLSSIGMRQRSVSQVSRNTLLALGVIRRRRAGSPRDWIAESLTSLYRCQDRKVWHALLSTEYEHALQVLLEAKARYPGARSEWLQLQDSFNDILVRKLFELLQACGLPGYSRTVDRNGRLVKYGSLIASNSPFDRTYPGIASRLRDFHNRRNTLPGSHPYDERGGDRNRWLSRQERNALSAKLRVALNDVTSIVEGVI